MRRLITVLAYVLVPMALAAQVSAPTKIDIRDEGASQGRVGAIDFVGSSVVATVSGDVATVTLSAGGGSATITSVTLDGLPDGMARFTVTDAGVTTTSKIIASVRRVSVDDVDDPGWLFVCNVVKVATGSFDVLVQIVGLGGEELIADPPVGPLTLDYLVG